MADKKFGVKQINLIGASGTPTLTSPNNLNINATTVAISTDVTVGGDISVGGDVSIGGTFNALSVSGVSTFSGITTVTGETLFAKQLNVSGVSTFSTGVSKGVEFVNESDGGTIRISNDGGNSQGRIGFNGSVDSTLYASYTNGDIDFVAGNIFSLHLGSYTNYALRAYKNSSVELNYNNSKKFETTNTGIKVSGITSTTNLNVSGISTFQDDVNIGIGGTTAFFNVNTGFVGIGTDDPQTILHLEGSSPILRLEDTTDSQIDNGSVGKIEFYGNDGTNNGPNIRGFIQTISTSPLGNDHSLTFGLSGALNDAPSEILRLTSDG